MRNETAWGATVAHAGKTSQSPPRRAGSVRAISNRVERKIAENNRFDVTTRRDRRVAGDDREAVSADHGSQDRGPLVPGESRAPFPARSIARPLERDAEISAAHAGVRDRRERACAK